MRYLLPILAIFLLCSCDTDTASDEGAFVIIGNGLEIPNGWAVPTVLNATDLGVVAVDGQNDVTFSIESPTGQAIEFEEDTEEPVSVFSFDSDTWSVSQQPAATEAAAAGGASRTEFAIRCSPQREQARPMRAIVYVRLKHTSFSFVVGGEAGRGIFVLRDSFGGLIQANDTLEILGTTPQGQTTVTTLTIGNASEANANLVLDTPAITFSDGTVFRQNSNLDGLEIEPGDTQTIDIRYTPPRGGALTHTSRISLRSNDQFDPVYVFFISGRSVPSSSN